ncbi:wd40 repeat-containing protein : WD40 repeat-containing protein OS=Haliscomenobacter hydrossis (strain ATCC 27775 / DSM 1100 / LMG 10767 / O) GN=Halhy_6675 PE=4 SV=1: WD40: WD40: WD40: WD40: WD40: WD40 [Gemmata massiliana]|uniref:Uncharacterized protein n=1 Tax=Gemmata massiliana TaxID=1210884 RepID=A0A6P2CVW4_9BACT|nr:WD40 repeat domain-containing protein [Gemmata massiliana]VTR91844.1 wd40 repeat-containing protein : WD40 repeat-containing protein OS=Haliscomenobacter hydrossis (strain ATCC 27775 / DSM 1100 / LMG 10767 / O) GN=Halhy_6675 PE=4 SV=1: WD40: WD40: WD40: WD40: WD40: WD40 [Gemmata massiliana]
MRSFLAFALVLTLGASGRAAEPVVIRGHKDRINAVAFTPDNKILATGSTDKTVRLWDAKTGKELLSLEAHTGAVTGLAFSFDSKKLVTGGYGPRQKGTEVSAGEVKVWEVPSGKLLQTMEKMPFAVEAVAFDPNGRQVAANSGKLVHSWEVATGARKVTFEGHTEPVRGVGFDAQGARLVTTGEDGTVRVWHPDTGKLLHTFKGHQGFALATAVTPNGTRAVTGGQDHSVRIWNLETGKEERKLTSHGGPVSGVSMSSDGKTFAAASGLDSAVRIWETETGKEVRVLRLPKESRGPSRVAYSPDGKRIAVACFDNSLRVYDLD